jgi:plastocyanin
MKSFAYVPKEVRVKAGQTVQFRLLSTDIDHTFTVRDLKIDVLGKPGRPVVQELTLTAPGTYRVVCAIAGHEGAGMAGTLVVE